MSLRLGLHRCTQVLLLVYCCLSLLLRLSGIRDAAGPAMAAPASVGGAPSAASGSNPPGVLAFGPATLRAVIMQRVCDEFRLQRPADYQLWQLQPPT